MCSTRFLRRTLVHELFMNYPKYSWTVHEQVQICCRIFGYVQTRTCSRIVDEYLYLTVFNLTVHEQFKIKKKIDLKPLDFSVILSVVPTTIDSPFHFGRFGFVLLSVYQYRVKLVLLSSVSVTPFIMILLEITFTKLRSTRSHLLGTKNGVA